MALGLGLARAGAAAPRVAACVWVLLTVLHFYANVRAVRALRLTSVNRARADVVLDAWLRPGGGGGGVCGGGRSRAPPLSPDTANADESLLPPPLAAVAAWAGLAPRPAVRLGVPLGHVAAAAGVEAAHLAAGRGGRRVAVDPGGAFWAAAAPPAAGGGAVVALATAASPTDTLRAYATGRALAAGASPDASLASADALVAGMAAGGWEVGRVALGGGGVRVARSDGACRPKLM